MVDVKQNYKEIRIKTLTPVGDLGVGGRDKVALRIGDKGDAAVPCPEDDTGIDTIIRVFC